MAFNKRYERQHENTHKQQQKQGSDNDALKEIKEMKVIYQHGNQDTCFAILNSDAWKCVSFALAFNKTWEIKKREPQSWLPPPHTALAPLLQFFVCSSFKTTTTNLPSTLLPSVKLKSPSTLHMYHSGGSWQAFSLQGFHWNLDKVPLFKGRQVVRSQLGSSPEQRPRQL